MGFRRLVKGGSKHCTGNGITDDRDILRIDVDHEHEDMNVRIVFTDDRGEMLHDFGFAGLGRTEHQAALAETERRDQVHKAHIRERLAVFAFQGDPAAGIDGRQFIKSGTIEGFFLRDVIDTGNIQKRGVFIALTLGTDLSFNEITGAQSETADLCHGDIDILGGGLETGIAKETVSIGMKFQDAAAFFIITCCKQFLQRGSLDTGILRRNRREGRFLIALHRRRSRAEGTGTETGFRRARDPLLRNRGSDRGSGLFCFFFRGSCMLYRRLGRGRTEAGSKSAWTGGLYMLLFQRHMLSGRRSVLPGRTGCCARGLISRTGAVPGGV